MRRAVMVWAVVIVVIAGCSSDYPAVSPSPAKKPQKPASSDTAQKTAEKPASNFSDDAKDTMVAGVNAFLKATGKSSFSTDAYLLHLQKDINVDGIELSSFGRVVNIKADADRYSSTGVSVSGLQLDKLFEHSRASGAEPRVQVQSGFSGKGTRTFYYNVQVKDAKLGGPLMDAIRNRFQVEPPLRLAFFVDDQNQMYVDVIPTKPKE